MLDHELVPLVRDDVSDLYTIAVNGWWAIASWQHSVNHLKIWVKIALKPAITLGKDIEENGKVIGIEILVLNNQSSLA
jgi:hypothetical protein